MSVDTTDARLTATDLNAQYARPATGDIRVEAEAVRAAEGRP